MQWRIVGEVDQMGRTSGRRGKKREKSRYATITHAGSWTYHVTIPSSSDEWLIIILYKIPFLWTKCYQNMIGCSPCPYLPLHAPMSHYVPLCAPMCPYMTLLTTIYPYMPLSTTTCPYVLLPAPTCPYMPICAPFKYWNMIGCSPSPNSEW